METKRSFKATPCKRCQDTSAGNTKASQTSVKENKKMNRRAGK